MFGSKRGAVLAGAIAASIIGSFFGPARLLRIAAGTPAPIDFQSRRIDPAGRLILSRETGKPAVMPLTFNFVRTPDTGAADGKGRFLIAVNSGYGLTFNSKSKGQQTLSVIDLNTVPEPQVVQDIYFPAPQSANFGLVFDSRIQSNGKYNLYLSGGFENKIWMLAFDPAAPKPIAPGNEPDTEFKSTFIDVTAFSDAAPSPNYNSNVAPVYPTGLALSPDGNALFVANNLGDSLGVVNDLRDRRLIRRVRLGRPGSKQFVYPYDVKSKPARNGRSVEKVYVSCWGDGTVAVVDGATFRVRKHIVVGRHPTAMLFNKSGSRLYVVNSDGDSISVIDTVTDAEVPREPRISVRLNENGPGGVGPQGIALSEDEKTLYVANSKTNAVAVVALDPKMRSRVAGFIPTGNYPSAIAIANGKLLIANGKGIGMENSSNDVNESGMYPNMPNQNYPGERYNKRGIYSATIVSGNVSVVNAPNQQELFVYSQRVMRDNGMLGARKPIFPNGRSPFKHVIYIIRENRTYDQVLGDLENSGDGTKADGDASVAIFGAGNAARSPKGEPQNITPNARALALRFGLLDRFFVNSEASPDGHNWSTAAFSSDYIDKAFRWDYSGRGRTYDYEGFNRLPSYDWPSGQPPVALPSVFELPATVDDVADFQKRYVPYLNGARDIGEPETLYLWDAAQRAGLSYRNYGEFVGTISEADLQEVNTGKSKGYPDLSPTLKAFATKKSLEGHFSESFRNYDLTCPDSMTVDSYRAALASNGAKDAAVSPDNPDFKGSTRFGEWAHEFRGYVNDLATTKVDRMPNLSIVRLSNDHTAGMSRNRPTPQFYVADNDYALGRLVQEVSNSPYWKDTAIFVVEDDAQDGPDHVDAHRSPAFVISAWNRKGALVHEFHSTVSLIRTLEICLGIKPMNFLDANAIPIDIFGETPDLTPFNAILPTVAPDNLMTPANPSRAALEMMRLTGEQDLRHADMANPRELNEIIWFSVRGASEKMPEVSRLPAFDVLTAGVSEEEDEESEEEAEDGP